MNTFCLEVAAAFRPKNVSFTEKIAPSKFTMKDRAGFNAVLSGPSGKKVAVLLLNFISTSLF